MYTKSGVQECDHTTLPALYELLSYNLYSMDVLSLQSNTFPIDEDILIYVAQNANGSMMGTPFVNIFDLL